jgi:hypothetical protein
LLHFFVIEYLHSFGVFLMFFDHLSDFFPIFFGLLGHFGHFIEFDVWIGQRIVGFLFSDFVLVKLHFPQLFNHDLFFLKEAFILLVKELTLRNLVGLFDFFFVFVFLQILRKLLRLFRDWYGWGYDIFLNVLDDEIEE